MLSIRPSDIIHSFQMEPQSNGFFTCHYCADQFKREDHLHRHELSHKSPRFKCLHEGCDKAFHRNDVLKRHQLVHRPGPEKRRGTTRKRVAPRPSSQQASADLTPAPGSTKHMEMMRTQSFLPPSYNNLASWDAASFHTRDTSFSINETFVQWPWSREDAFPYTSQDLTTTSQNIQIMALCIERACRSTLKRLPFIHNLTIDDPELPRELQLSLAAIGARDLDGNRGYGTDFFCEAVQLLDQTSLNKSLHRLQCQILLIEFAAWSGIEAHGQWAVKEQQVAALAIQQLLAAPKPVTESKFLRWLQDEELKRTAFAFYSQSLGLQAISPNYPIPLPLRHINLRFPCPDEIWQCTHDHDWLRKLSVWEATLKLPLTVPIAVQKFISGNVYEMQAQYQSLSPFCQHVVLCGIHEGIEVAKSSPLNHSYMEGWLTHSVASFKLSEYYLQVLQRWIDFWFLPGNQQWVSGEVARPRLESVLLHMQIRSKLTDMEGPINTRAVRDTAEDVTNCLWWTSQAGLDEFMANKETTLTPACRAIAFNLAQIHKRWLERLDMRPDTQELNERDVNILSKLRGAVMILSFGNKQSGSAFAYGTVTPGDLKELYAKTIEMWSFILSDSTWAAS